MSKRLRVWFLLWDWREDVLERRNQSARRGSRREGTREVWQLLLSISSFVIEALKSRWNHGGFPPHPPPAEACVGWVILFEGSMWKTLDHTQ